MKFFSKGRSIAGRLIIQAAFLGFALSLSGCLSAPEIYPPGKAPSYVREIKYVRIFGYDTRKQFGVELAKEELVTIMARGRISRGPSNILGALRIMAWIGEDLIGSPFGYANGATFKSPYSGQLSMGVMDPRPRDSSGHFDIIAVVWKTRDYSKIIDFLELLQMSAPGHLGIEDAIAQAKNFQEIDVAKTLTSSELAETNKKILQFHQETAQWPATDAAKYAKRRSDLENRLAELQDRLSWLNELEATASSYGHIARFSEIIAAKSKATEEIESTRKELSALLDIPIQSAPPLSASTHQRVRELESRLAELTAKLAQLDELGRQIKSQREKSVQLSRELSERDNRQQELMKKIEDGVDSPPLLLISSPEDGAHVTAGKVRLTGAAEDDKGLLRLDIFSNGQPLKAEAVENIKLKLKQNSRSLTFDQPIQLKPGSNHIQIRVTDTDGLITEKTITVHSTPSERNVWAVVVGINDYPQLPRLKYAVSDAREFYRLLVERNRVPEKNITLLVNDQASLGNLRSLLGTHLKEAAGKEDMVIIFFAGHGAAEADSSSAEGDGLEKYLMTWEANPRDLYATAMPMVEVARILNRIRSERLVFIVDSCYSGASGGRTVSTGGIRANISDTFLDRIAGGRGKVIITASAANEVSVEKDELRHGVFTYYLLEGLRGAADSDRDGTITVDEAYRYVSEKVPRATGQEQHPVKKGTVEGDLVISLSN
jgi:hypothetical protein